VTRSGIIIIGEMIITSLHRSMVALLLLSLFVPVCFAEDLTQDAERAALDLSGLAAKARARQVLIERELANLDARTAPDGTDPAVFATTQSEERSRLEALKSRNAQVLKGYESRLANSSGPAAPIATSESASQSSEGSTLQNLAGLLGGGANNPLDAMTDSAALSGLDSGSGIMDYLSQNWLTTLGGMAGSIGGYYLGESLGASLGSWGGTIGGIAGSMALGWLGQQAGSLVQELWNGGSGGSSFLTATQGSQADPIQTYGGDDGSFSSQTSSSQYQSTPVPQTTDLAEARQLMLSRYNEYVAASGPDGDPARASALYGTYMQAKQQFEQLQIQSLTGTSK